MSFMLMYSTRHLLFPDRTRVLSPRILPPNCAAKRILARQSYAITTSLDRGNLVQRQDILKFSMN